MTEENVASWVRFFIGSSSFFLGLSFLAHGFDRLSLLILSGVWLVSLLIILFLFNKEKKK